MPFRHRQSQRLFRSDCAYRDTESRGSVPALDLLVQSRWITEPRVAYARTGGTSAPLPNEPTLECDPGVYLHDPRSESIRELTKACIIHAGLKPGEVRMVEGIKHVGTDLQFKVFPE